MGFSKVIIYVGLFITITGIILYFGSKIGIPFFKLPGDISIQKEKYSIYFPIVTSIVISIFLTILLNLIIWIFRK